MQKEFNMIDVADRVCDIMSDLEKGAEMMRQLAGGHFSVQSVNVNETKGIQNEEVLKLLYNYNTNKIVFEIACEYVHKSLERLQELDKEI